MIRSNIDKMPEFEKLAKPLIKFLCENFNPHCTIIITSNNAELLSGEMFIPCNEFIVD